jgi:hypothetical protein
MKDTKINIKMNNDKLTTEEISKGKDFNSLYKKYTTTTTKWYKSPKKLGGISSVVVVTTVTVTLSLVKYTKHSNPVHIQPKPVIAATSTVSHATTRAATAKFVNPPIKGADIPYKSFTVNAQKGGELKYGNSSKINIPKGSFVYKDGREVQGNVVIKYREFHNPVDFFLSGIPMTYDSAGKQYTFESAGMLDIRGFKDGVPVEIAKDKKIDVQMASVGTGTEYNTYRLDTVTRKWVYIERRQAILAPADKTTPRVKKDSILPEQHEITAEKAQIAKTQADEKKLESALPIQPQKASATSYTFDINADPKEFPEMAVYKNMLFQVDAADKNFKPEYTKDTWEDATLNRQGSGNNYTFTVKKGGESHTFMVHPVFEGKNYDAAMAEYSQKYQQYETSLAAKKAEEKKEQDAYLTMVKTQEAIEKAEEEAYQKRLLAENTGSGVINYLQVRSFGFYNCDHPDVFPEGASLMPRYADNKQDNLNSTLVYIAEKGRNALFCYSPGQNFRFNPHKDNFSWCVTPDGKVAVFTKDDFKKIQQREGGYTFNMNVIDKNVETADDVKNIFKDFL